MSSSPNAYELFLLSLLSQGESIDRLRARRFGVSYRPPWTGYRQTVPWRGTEDALLRRAPEDAERDAWALVAAERAPEALYGAGSSSVRPPMAPEPLGCWMIPPAVVRRLVDLGWVEDGPRGYDYTESSLWLSAEGRSALDAHYPIDGVEGVVRQLVGRGGGAVGRYPMLPREVSDVRSLAGGVALDRAYRDAMLSDGGVRRATGLPSTRLADAERELAFCSSDAWEADRSLAYLGGRLPLTDPDVSDIHLPAGGGLPARPLVTRAAVTGRSGARHVAWGGTRAVAITRMLTVALLAERRHTIMGMLEYRVAGTYAGWAPQGA